jgi:Sec-independent protein secretion pathway component TatC
MMNRLRRLEDRLFIVRGTQGLKVLTPSLFAILLAVLALPSRLISSSSFDGYSSVAALFLQDIKQGLLPPHWLMIAYQPNEYLEVYVVGSVLLALMLGSPLIEFWILDRIVPAEASRKRLTVFSLTMLSSAAFLTGALFGYYFLAKFVLAISFQFGVFPPVIDLGSFYFLMLRTIGLSAVSFALAVFVGAAVFFRRRKQ